MKIENKTPRVTTTTTTIGLDDDDFVFSFDMAHGFLNQLDCHSET